MVRKLSQKEAEAKISKNGLQLISPYINRRTKVTIKCYCGQVFRTMADSAMCGTCKSCGCARLGINTNKNILGNRFHKLIVLKHISKDRHGNYIWECLCDCGRKSKVPTNHLVTGNTKSCGNCNLMRNGRATSFVALKLNSLIGRGVHNYKSHCGLNIDIAYVLNNRKIAIEYNGWYWHKDKNKDQNRVLQLNKSGWKVLTILGRQKLPEIQVILSSINELINTDTQHIELTVKDWN